MDWGPVEKALEEAHYHEGRKSHVFPGAVLLVGQAGDILYKRAFGCRSIVPKVTPLSEDMVFDVASLTKPIVTTTLLMKLVERGQIEIDRKLSRIFQTFGSHGKEQMTIRHLLTHCSGYPDTLPFYRRIAKVDSAERAGIMTSRGAVEMILNEIFRARLEHLPGRVAKYSDIGFILLGAAIEVIYGGKFLDRLAAEQIFGPLEMRSSGFIDLSKVRRKGIETVNEIIVPTTDDNWRRKILLGEVFDPNAWVMGGVAGHAGLFSTAEDIHLFATEMLRCWKRQSDFIDPRVVEQFWARDKTVPGSSWALGWDTKSEARSSSGQFFSANSVGHLAYTGCSLWIDPERELDVILLSNRIHPSVDNKAIRDFRPKIHDLVMQTLGYAS